VALPGARCLRAPPSATKPTRTEIKPDMKSALAGLPGTRARPLYTILDSRGDVTLSGNGPRLKRYTTRSVLT
jgi:hypothetical protein